MILQILQPCEYPDQRTTQEDLGLPTPSPAARSHGRVRGSHGEQGQLLLVTWPKGVLLLLPPLPLDLWAHPHVTELPSARLLAILLGCHLRVWMGCWNHFRWQEQGCGSGNYHDPKLMFTLIREIDWLDSACTPPSIQVELNCMLYTVIELVAKIFRKIKCIDWHLAEHLMTGLTINSVQILDMWRMWRLVRATLKYFWCLPLYLNNSRVQLPLRFLFLMTCEVRSFQTRQSWPILYVWLMDWYMSISLKEEVGYPMKFHRVGHVYTPRLCQT